jgi:hypothetical protein
MTQTLNPVDYHNFCSLDNSCKAVFECCDILASDNCNANISSTSFATFMSDRTCANDTAAADFFTACNISW